MSLPVEYVSPSVSTCWMQAPICLCLLGPHLSLAVGYMSPSVLACWICVPVCLSMLGMSLCPPLPVRYESPPASACRYLSPFVSACWICVLPTSACWACVHPFLCLLDAHLHLSLSVGGLSLPVGCLSAPQQLRGMGLSLCRPTGDAEGSLQAMGTGEERGKERGEGVGLELGNHRP